MSALTSATEPRSSRRLRLDGINVEMCSDGLGGWTRVRMPNGRYVVIYESDATVVLYESTRAFFALRTFPLADNVTSQIRTLINFNSAVTS